MFDEILAGYMNKPFPKRKHWLSDCDPNVTSQINWQEQNSMNENKLSKESLVEEPAKVNPKIPNIKITLPPNLDEKIKMRLRSLTLSPTSPPLESVPMFEKTVSALQPPYVQRVKHQSFGTFDGSFEGESSENDMSSLGDKLYVSSPEAKTSLYFDSEVEEKDYGSPLKSLVMDQDTNQSTKKEPLPFVKHKLQKNFVKVPVPLIFDDSSEDELDDVFSFSSSVCTSVYSDTI